MSKYTITTTKRIIGYDSDTEKIIIYTPQEVEFSQLTDKEAKALLKHITEHPEGGDVVREDI